MTCLYVKEYEQPGEMDYHSTFWPKIKYHLMVIKNPPLEVLRCFGEHRKFKLKQPCKLSNIILKSKRRFRLSSLNVKTTVECTVS